MLSDSIKEWLPIATSFVGLISAIIGILIALRTLARVRREEQLREEEAAHRKLQTEALIEALFGVDSKITERENQLRLWIEEKLAELEYRFNESLSTVITRLAPTQQKGKEVHDLAVQEHVKTLDDELRGKEVLLQGVRKAIVDIDAGRSLDEIQQDLLDANARALDVADGGLVASMALGGVGLASGVLFPILGPLIAIAAFKAWRETEKRKREREVFKLELKSIEERLVQEIEMLRLRRSKYDASVSLAVDLDRDSTFVTSDGDHVADPQ